MKLKVERLFKIFGDHRALDDVSMEVQNVHSLVLIGPSGGGKSTLLRIIAGLESPTSGSVEIDGEPVVYREMELRAHRRKMGFVFQAFNLFPHLTALENIKLPLEKVHRIPSQDAHEIALQSLRRFDLENHSQKKPAELSGGQKQRVAIARAVAIKPRLLLLDEPTSALDPEMTAEVLDVIVELKKESRDLILVTHEMGFARSVADHAVFIAHGKILEMGRGSDIFDDPRTDASQRFFARILRQGPVHLKPG